MRVPPTSVQVSHRVWSSAGETTARWHLAPPHVHARLAVVMAHRKFTSPNWFEKNDLGSRRVKVGEEGTDIDTIGLHVYNEDQLAAHNPCHAAPMPAVAPTPRSSRWAKPRPASAADRRADKFYAGLRAVVARRRERQDAAAVVEY